MRTLSAVLNPASQWTNPFASLDTELSPAMHAVRRTKNSVQRLRHLTVTARHRTLRSAAAELEVTWGTLTYQLRSIEETVGFTILDFGRGRRITVTDRGRDFLDEAAQLLSLLNGPGVHTIQPELSTK